MSHSAARKSPRVVLTGATGAIGPETLRELRGALPDAQFVVLARDPTRVPHTARTTVLAADIAKPGLDSAPARLALRTATWIIHMAADVRWNQPWDHAFR